MKYEETVKVKLQTRCAGAVRRVLWGVMVLTGGAGVAAAQQAAPEASTPGAASSEPLVVVGSRTATSALMLPAAVDSVSARASALSQPGVNASETLAGQAGLVVNNRQNFAQDLQLSIRGFGARATFGVRGVRLLQDGIPLTMPDGSGQTGSFDLDGADHWEILRGPLSVMYGNSAGGVVQLFSDFTPNDDHVRVSGAGGSNGLAKLGLGFKADIGSGVLAGNAAHMQTDGWRAHSAAARDTLNLRGRFNPTPDQQWTVIANVLNQPDTQDPLGLTQAQVAADPQQAGTGALTFNTRKSIVNQQLGVQGAFTLSPALSLKATAYGGMRDILQFLALAGTPATSSGGVVHLARNFQGLDLQATLKSGALTTTAGLTADQQREWRTGYVNNNGVAGAVRRDENNTARNTDLWLQGQWLLHEDVDAIVGVRRSSVRFDVRDHYITASNPDDSGGKTFDGTSAMAGLSWRFAPGHAAYASIGRGFETPTLVEFAYRPDGLTGSNLALKAATHDTLELGVKSQRAQGNWRVALYTTRVADEIVAGPQVAVGRNTYVNAARTRRDGVELQWQHDLGTPDWKAALAASALRARFDSFTGTSGVNLDGKALPGIATRTASAEIAWQPSRTGWSAAAEARAASRVWVNDANSAAAPGYGLLAVRTRYVWGCGAQDCAVYARIDNLAGRRSIGSVIVNAANGQFYEPAPGRTFTVGFNLRLGRGG